MAKTLSDWLAHLEGLHPKGQGGIELGLTRVARVKAQLAQTQHCPVIIVGGTNGKGSTCAYLEAIYRAAGIASVAIPRRICSSITNGCVSMVSR